MADRKLLCVADDSPECRSAVVFGAIRAARTQAGLVIMRVVEPLDPGLWSSMGEEMRERMRLEALADLQTLSDVAWASAQIIPELVVREGGLQQEIRGIIDETPQVKTLILGASSSRGGPGPLVGAATRGGFSFGKRAVAIMIVPDGLSDEELSALAG
jgi:Universal stress protein family